MKNGFDSARSGNKFGLAILTPDSINDGCWNNIINDIRPYFEISDSFCVSPLPINTVGQLYGWEPPYTFGMQLKSRLFSSGISHVLLMTAKNDSINPSLQLQKMKGSYIPESRDSSSIRGKYQAVNLALNLIHTSDDGIAAIEDYNMLTYYKLEDCWRNHLHSDRKNTLKRRYSHSILAFYHSLKGVLDICKIETPDLDADHFNTGNEKYDLDEFRLWLNKISKAPSNISERQITLASALSDWNKYSPKLAEELPSMIENAMVTIDEWSLLVLQSSIYQRFLTVNRLPATDRIVTQSKSSKKSDHNSSRQSAYA